MGNDGWGARVARLASAQWGLVTTAQAAAAGVPRLALSRMERAGELERLEHGVYRHASVPEDQYTRLRAAWLSLRPSETAERRLREHPLDAVVSHETAAWLLGAGDFMPEPYHFSTPQRKQTQRPSIRLSVKRYGSEDVVIRHGLPTTDLCRTVADLVAAGADLSLVSGMFLDPGRGGLEGMDSDRLASLLAPYAKRYGFEAGDGRGLRDGILAPLDRSIAGIARQLADLAASGAGPRTAMDALAGAVAPQLQGTTSQMREITDAFNRLCRLPTRAVKETIQCVDVPQSRITGVLPECSAPQPLQGGSDEQR